MQVPLAQGLLPLRFVAWYEVETVYKTYQRWQKAWGGTNRHISGQLKYFFIFPWLPSLSLMRWIWKSWSTLYEWLHSHPKQNAAGDFSGCATCLQWTIAEYGKGGCTWTEIFGPHRGNKNSPERRAARFLFQTLVLTGIDGAISRSSACNKASRRWKVYPIGDWWAEPRNTKQLRNQYVADTTLGYPMCLSTCPNQALDDTVLLFTWSYRSSAELKVSASHLDALIVML